MLEEDSEVKVYCESSRLTVDSELDFLTLDEFEKLHVIESGENFFLSKISKKNIEKK